MDSQTVRGFTPALEGQRAPDVLAAEIAEDVQSALEQFNSVVEELQENKEPSHSAREKL